MVKRSTHIACMQLCILGNVAVLFLLLMRCLLPTLSEVISVNSSLTANSTVLKYHLQTNDWPR